MSWQAYVDTNLCGAGLKSAAIVGHNGGTWATSSGFSVSQTEATNLVKGFANSNVIRASGIHLAGVKYIALRADDRSIYGKKGAGGCCCVKTGQAVLIGVYDENLQPGAAAKVVEALADYLIDAGY
mmetsp:Transcript_13095/g.19777  ORF Transcript_13095/g.19777 Transcript_13095/m.19777 type:complete len:126 (+) Transcript_13095:247-624(+)